MKLISERLSFLTSSLTLENEFQSNDDFSSWFRSKANNKFEVNEIPFSKLENWYFEEKTGNLRHTSGKFFSVEGIKVSTNFGHKQSWEQPIIIQPEIGILGIVTKVVNGTRYFLMQAKMEPGNINIVQLSPTVQATKSNYTKVHNGKLPRYLEYFNGRSNSKILIDQLQPEQAGRFLKKRNRNMVVEVYDEVNVHDDFIWLTLAQIKLALQIDNMVNMDSRSVLATIPFIEPDQDCTDILDAIENPDFSNWGREILLSAICTDVSQITINEIISWISCMKARFELHVDRIPLHNTENWILTESSIKHCSDHFFSVIAVRVKAYNREIHEWTQPLIKEQNLGLIGFLIKPINGVFHFLVQAKVEPGSIDTIDLSPTVSCSNYMSFLDKDHRPVFLDYFINPDPGMICLSTIQSEEGGRFFHFQNRNMIVRVPDDDLSEVPDNYKWLSLSQMMQLLKFGLFNVEARSIISALKLI